MTYKIEFSKQATKEFESLSKDIQRNVAKRIDFLSHNPSPHGATKLHGEDELYRVRAGDYRVIYQIKDKLLLVLVVKIGNRKEVYR